MISDPLVTVITPAYNLGHYLAETIDSVLAQDYPHIEYIVLDDGSQDNTREILNAYTGRIIWESHDNMGEARTVNKGFAMANGEFIIVVNADDPILPGMIRGQVTYHQTHTDVLATYPDWIAIDEQSQPIEKIHAPDYDYEMMVSRVWCIPGPGAMIRRTAIEHSGGRNAGYRFVTDMDFWFRIGLNGRLARIPKFLATHRTHPTSSGVANQVKVGTEIITYIQDFFNNPDLPENVKRLADRALASAYFEAGSREPSYRKQRTYFWQSFKRAPVYWFIYRKPADVYQVWLLPEIVKKVMDKLRQIFLTQTTNKTGTTS